MQVSKEAQILIEVFLLNMENLGFETTDEVGEAMAIVIESSSGEDAVEDFIAGAQEQHESIND